MTISKVSGRLLEDNLLRDSNLAVDTNTLFIDVVNQRIGVATTSPTTILQVNGNAKLDGVTISGNSISSDSGLLELGSNANVQITGGTTGFVLTTDGAGNLTWTSPGNLSGVIGNTIALGTPTDGNLVENVAYDGWSTTTVVTDGLDDLNQVSLNIANNTYVGQVEFVANVTAGPSPMSVLFTTDLVGNATDFLWDFGDGANSTTGPDVTHTFSNVSGGQFTVSVTAFNSEGTYEGNVSLGAKGSVDSQTRTNYITLYTPTPIPAFTITDDTIDSASNAEITNSSQFATNYQLDWGDGAGNIDPGNSWTTVENTYTNSGGDEQYTITLFAISTTAGPSNVTVDTSDTIDVFSTHTTTFSANTITVINEEATSGGVVEFENTTATDPGNTATFGSQQKYLWTWGDGNVANVNIQNALAGNPGANITHTFALSSSDQSNGNTATFDVNLQTRNGHTTSPFASANTTITVEPDVRAIFTGTAIDQSDRVGDDAQDGYLFTDYRNSNNRAVFTFDNSSQNANLFTWDFGDGNITANIPAGNTGTPGAANITHTYGATGSNTVELDISGTPATIAQTDTETKSNYITIRTNPAQPTALSGKTLSMATSSQGTSPKLAAGATDNTSGNIVANGTSVTRYTSSSPVQTTTVTDANTSISGTLAAYVNGSDSGNVTFSANTNSSGTYTSLVVSDDRDAHDAVSSSTYPSGFAKVFDAKVSESFAGISVGYNEYQLSHTTAGATNTVGFVKDDMTDVPTVVQSGASISEGTAGTYRYISGIPYYNTGSPTVIISGLAVGNLVGQTYRDTSSPIQFTTGTLDESTSGSILSTQTKTYSDIDGSSSFLTGGIPNADTGVGSNYTMGNITLSINGTSRVVGYIDSQMFNVNGSSSVVDITDKRIQVYSASISGFNEEIIPVSDSLGTIYDDDGLRVATGLSGDTPAFSDTDYYTGNVWSGAETIAGTDESVVRWGTLQHFDDTDFSSGYLPAGPDLVTGRSGTQYFTFAFRRATVASFDITITTSTGISGMWIAAPGTAIDAASGINGWLECTTQYGGAGVPGSDTGNGGNGSDGCALTGADIVPTGTPISATSYTMTLGSENMSNATGNNVLVRIALASGETISSLSIGVAS